jgi:hypothetical protein
MTLAELVDDLGMARSMRECILADLVGVMKKCAHPATCVIDFNL